MTIRIEPFKLAFCSAAMLTLAGCGGGGGDSAAPASTTTNVSTKVIDGALKNALVCLDKNINGKCDTDEVQGRTDIAGNVTLAVPNADVGKYPVIAVVGTDAVDADHGPVTVAYTLSAPADHAGVVSPLTTLVQQTVASSGATSAEAAKSVQDATGISVSLFEDFTASSAGSGGVSASTVARLLVVTTQQQAAAIASTVGAQAADGASITEADLDKAIRKKLIELLPSLVSALNDPSVKDAATPAAKEAALLAAAGNIVTNEGIAPAAVATTVAVNNQAATAPAATPAPSAFIQLAALTFGGPTNYNARLLTGSLAQNTPDSTSNTRYVDRRLRAIGTNLAKWGAGGDPARGADLSWNGTAWVGCPINYENVSSVRDASGNSVYNYCDRRETGKSSRATFDIAGKTLAEVYAQIRTAGITNLFVADPSVLGTASFPAGSAVFYQTTTPLTNAISYYPAGADSPAGTSNVATQFSAAVSAGGEAAAQPDGTGCNKFSLDANGNKVYERNTNGVNSTTLEGMVALKTGTPCVYAAASFTYGGTTFTATEPNAGWGTATVSLGKIGSVPLNSGTAPGFYSGNLVLRAAFTGGNAVTYYACKERFDNGNVRACSSVGTGTYAIATLGDARVMTFADLPAATAPLNYTRVFVERGGLVYLGYQSKPLVTNVARLNTVAATAFLTKLGIPVEDPASPLALTAGSYQGTWDFRSTGSPVAGNVGTTVFINGNGSVSCVDKSDGVAFACSATITDPATGAFTYADATSTAAGNFNFLTGKLTGTFNDPTVTPSTGTLLGGRR